MIERPECPLTREDFFSAEEWHRHCHEGGEFPWRDEERRGWRYPAGTGPYSDLTRAILGQTPRQHALAWEGYGASSHLALDQLKQAYGGIALANCRGRILDSHLTVTWSTLGDWSELSIFFFQKRLLELFRKWLLKRGHWPAWLWVLEQGRRRGLHTHLLISIPGELRSEFRAYASRALETVCGKPPVNTSQEKTLMLTGGLVPSVERQWLLFRYIFKGLSPKAAIQNPFTGCQWASFAEYAGIRARDQGEVQVKRMGLSRDLDRAAQIAWQMSGGPALHLDPNLPASEIFGHRFYSWFQQNQWS